MTKHIKHHYLLSTATIVVAFAGMMIFRNTTGNVVFQMQGGNLTKVIISFIVMLGLLLFFERGRHEH